MLDGMKTYSLDLRERVLAAWTAGCPGRKEGRKEGSPRRFRGVAGDAQAMDQAPAGDGVRGP